MSATAPSDEAWAALCAQVATLQADLARATSRIEVLENRLTTIEQEPTFDPSDLTELADEVRALRQYVATRDDISEMRLM